MTAGKIWVALSRDGHIIDHNSSREALVTTCLERSGIVLSAGCASAALREKLLESVSGITITRGKIKVEIA